MATFYKYQERDLDSQVNYADIGLGISNLVTDQLATRKAKKEAYDDQVRAFNQYLDEHPVGDDVNMTEFTASYASQMQQQMLANQRAFKNGMVSERDNVVFMQNVQNGTKTMFDLSTDYQTEYTNKMERLKSTDPKNKSQLIETWLMQNAEGYGNFKNAKPIIDPKTGLVLMSVKQKDGTYQTSSAADLQTRIKAKYDYFDTDAAATAVETGIGEEITSALKAAGRGRGGSITQVQDKEIKDGFKDALNLQLESYLENPLATSSILTNTLNKNYTPTFSREEAEKDPTKILMITVPGGNGTPMPDFSTANGKKQRAEALDYMYKQVIQKIDRKVGQDAIGPIQDKQKFAPQGKSGYDYQQQNMEAAAEVFASNMYTFYHSTDPAEVQTAGNYLVMQGAKDETTGIPKILNLGKNEYGSFGTGNKLPGTSGQKQGEALVGVLGLDPAYAEIVNKIYIAKGGGSTISSTKGQSTWKGDGTPKTKTTSGTGSTQKAGL